MRRTIVPFDTTVQQMWMAVVAAMPHRPIGTPKRVSLNSHTEPGCGQQGEPMKRNDNRFVCALARTGVLRIGCVLSLTLLSALELLSQPKTENTVRGTVAEILWSNYGSQAKVNVNGKVYQLDLAGALTGRGATDQEAKTWADSLQKLHPGDAVIMVIRGALNESPGGVTPTISIRPAPSPTRPTSTPPGIGTQAPNCSFITVDEMATVLGTRPVRDNEADRKSCRG